MPRNPLSPDLLPLTATRIAAATIAVIVAACGTTPSAPPVLDRSSGDGANSSVRAVPRPLPQAGSNGSVGSIGPRGGAFYKDDGPGDNPPDLNAIAEPEPRVEALSRFANNPYNVFGVDYTPLRALVPFKQRGVGSWYGRKFHGQRTSSGEPYDMYGMTAAHPTLPIPSYVRVTNVANGRNVIVRVNDRGPFHAGRVIDLSYTAAWKLGYASVGSTAVEVELLTPDAIIAVTQHRRALQIAAAGERNAGTTSAEPAPQPAPERAAAVQVSALPESPLPQASALPVDVVAGKVFLQIGAFSARDNAENFRAHVYHDLNWLNDPIEIVQKDGLFRLHLGPYKDRGDAGSMAERIRAALELKPLVVVR